MVLQGVRYSSMGPLLRSMGAVVLFMGPFLIVLLGVPWASGHELSPTRCGDDTCNLNILGTQKPFFANATLAVKPGATIVVENHDGYQTHTVSSGKSPLKDKIFDTRNLKPGEQASFEAPTSPGTYLYFCSIHAGMQGRLIVDPTVPEFPGATVALTFGLVVLVVAMLIRRRSNPLRENT